MNIKRLKVDREAFLSGTYGIIFLECNQSTFDDIESRFSAFNIAAKPTVGGFAYNNFNNPQAIGGAYNFWFDSVRPGFANENVVIGGRGFCTSDTVTNFRLEGGVNENGHNRLIGVSLEGQGASGVYDNGSANSFFNCRSEGVWQNAFHQVGPDASYYTIISGRYDYTVDAPLRDEQRGTIITYRDGTSLNTAINGVTTLQVRNNASANGVGIHTVMNLDNSDPAIKVSNEATGIDRFTLTSRGDISMDGGINMPLSGWNNLPLTIRSSRVWTRSDNIMLQKNGSDPTHEDDGNSVGFGSTQLSVGNPGSGEALPSNPAGYAKVRVGNNDFLIPYYNEQ